MKCTNTLTLADIGTVPCGRCMACRINRTQEWAIRIMHELDYWKTATFLTLTYNDENINSDMGLHKRDFQLFMKRLREDLKPLKIKYYACGEYGELTKRPHYHAIIFGVPCNSNLFEENWKKGFVKAGNVTYQSAAYVSSYIQKKLGGIMAKQEYGGKEPPFQLQSNGIGEKWIIDHENVALVNGVIHNKGKEIPLPRYYRKKLGNKLDKEKFDAERIIKRNDKLEQFEIRGKSVLSEAEEAIALKKQKREEQAFLLSKKRTKSL